MTSRRVSLRQLRSSVIIAAIPLVLALAADEARGAERPRQGLFVRASGLVIDAQNDGAFSDDVLDDPADVDFDTGGGFSVGLGYRYYPAPISLEVEYAFRYVPGEVRDALGRRIDDTNISAHTIGANLVFDADDVVGPIGVYAGVGVGVRISELRISTNTIPGDDDDDDFPRSTTEASGNGFFWQAQAGLTFSIDQQTQLYAGVRWVDLGRLDEDGVDVDAELLNIEFGLRYYF